MIEFICKLIKNPSCNKHKLACCKNTEERMKRKQSRKIAALVAGALFAVSGSAGIANAARLGRENSFTAYDAAAEEAVSLQDKNLFIANSTSFDGVRVSITGQVESDKPEAAYARRTVWYAGIGEGERDLSEAESISVKLKFVTANSNRIFIVLADGSGNTAVSKFFANRPNDGKPLGSKFYDESGAEVSLTEAGGSVWEGVTVKNAGTAGTLVCAKDGFYTAESMWKDNAANAQINKNEYGIADKTVTPSGTFDWSDVRRVMVSVVVWNVNTLDIGDISATDGNGEKTLFDASESERKAVQNAADIAGLKKDEWAFAPRLNYIETWQNDKGGVFENLGKENATITAAYATENSIVLGRKTAAEGTAAPSYDVWKRFVTEPDSDYGDISAYEAFSFDLDSTSLASDGKIEFELRVKNIGGEKGADGNELAYIAYRGYGNGTTSDNYFHLIDGEGNLKTNSSMGKGGNIIPKGFNGSYMIPFGAFQRTVKNDDGENTVVRPTEEELKSAISLLIVFSASDYEGSETVSMGNVKLIDDYSAQIPLYAVNNELRSMRSKINDDNYETQKNLVQKAESGYENLTAEQKGLVKNYEKLAETKAAVAAYGVSLTERKIDGLETEISGENYKAAKRAYAAVLKQYEALGSDKAKVKNAEKLSAAADAIETYEAGTVSEKMNALLTTVDGETIEDARRAIDEAKEAYDELSESAKAKVTGLDKLSAAENAVNEYDAAPVSAMLAALTESVTADNYEAAKAAFKEAQEAYAALSAGAQDKVQNTEKFAAAKGAIEAYEKSLEKKGCGGEITSAAAVFAASAAVLAAACGKKKKKRDAEEGERK